jgi:integrase
MIGSIQKRRGKRGITWTVVVDGPPHAITGRRTQRRLSAPTKRELEAKLAAYLQSMQTGGIVDDGRITLGEFLERWLGIVESTVRPATFRRYHDMVRRDINPLLGGIRLEKLGPADVQALYANRLNAGLSPTTVSNLHYMFHRALKQAVRWGLVVRNVTEAVDPPRRSTPEATVWSTEQVASFLAASRDGDYEALWWLALMTGMRRGEILGLRWEDVNLARGVLAVRRTLSRGTGSTWEVGVPKTAKGRRSVALPPSVVDALRRHQARQLEHRRLVGPAYADHGFVFATPLGQPLHPRANFRCNERFVTARGSSHRAHPTNPSKAGWE